MWLRQAVVADVRKLVGCLILVHRLVLLFSCLTLLWFTGTFFAILLFFSVADIGIVPIYDTSFWSSQHWLLKCEQNWSFNIFWWIFQTWLLLFQSKGAQAPLGSVSWPPNYTAWWVRHISMNNLPRVVTLLGAELAIFWSRIQLTNHRVAMATDIDFEQPVHFCSGVEITAAHCGCYSVLAKLSSYLSFRPLNLLRGCVCVVSEKDLQGPGGTNDDKSCLSRVHQWASISAWPREYSLLLTFSRLFQNKKFDLMRLKVSRCSPVHISSCSSCCGLCVAIA